MNHGMCSAKGGFCKGCCTRIENFGVRFGRDEILSNVNMHIHCGELTAIIGPNGAGKSTLLKAMLGEVRHTGQVRFVNASSEVAKQPRMGYVPQQLKFDSTSPVSVLDLFGSVHSRFPVWLTHTRKVREKAVEMLRQVEAEHVIDKRLGNLSGGELQRVLLALALDPVPSLLLLDEPVSGIDQSGMEVFYRILSELKEKYDMSIILVSHDLELVSKYADRVVLLNRTVQCIGSPAKVFSDGRMGELFGSVWMRPEIGPKANAEIDSVTEADVRKGGDDQ